MSRGAWSMTWIRTLNMIHQNYENLFSFSAWFHFLNWLLLSFFFCKESWVVFFKHNIIIVIHINCLTLQAAELPLRQSQESSLQLHHFISFYNGTMSPITQNPHSGSLWLHLWPSAGAGSLPGCIQRALICRSYLKCSLFCNLFRWCDSI